MVGRAQQTLREPTESSNTASKPSYILDALRCFDLLNGLDLVGVGFYPPLRHKEPDKLAERDSKHALLGVELEVDLAQICKGLVQILNQSCSVFALDHYVIHVCLYIFVQLWLKSFVNYPCKC